MRDFLVDMFLYSSLENMVIYGYFLAVNKIKINFKRDILLITLLSFISALGCRIVDPLLWQFVGFMTFTLLFALISKITFLKSILNTVYSFVVIMSVDTLFIIVILPLFGIDPNALGTLKMSMFIIPARVAEILLIGVMTWQNGSGSLNLLKRKLSKRKRSNKMRG